VENCTKFGQMIVSKNIEIVATSCEILSIKCTKFAFCWGSAPDPVWELTSALPRPPSWSSGGLLLRGGMGKGKREGREEGENREEKSARKGAPPLFAGSPPIGCDWPLRGLGIGGAVERGKKYPLPKGMAWIRHSKETGKVVAFQRSSGRTMSPASSLHRTASNPLLLSVRWCSSSCLRRSLAMVHFRPFVSIWRRRRRCGRWLAGVANKQWWPIITYCLVIQLSLSFCPSNNAVSLYSLYGLKRTYIVPIPKTNEFRSKPLTYDDFSHTIYSVRNIVYRFVTTDSTINLCAIDLSKEFVKMNYYMLYRCTPVQQLELLENSLSYCNSCVEWLDAWLSAFNIDSSFLSPLPPGVTDSRSVPPRPRPTRLTA